MKREIMEFDVLIVGAGPAGLSAACRLIQLAEEHGQTLEVCVLEKGSEVGAHIMSGAVFESRALDELFPDWQQLGAPIHTGVNKDQMFLLKDEHKSHKIPHFAIPKSLQNAGNHLISLGLLCRWLGEQAEALGVNIFPGFAAAELLKGEQGEILGVITGDMGRSAEGSEKGGFEAGMELRAKQVIMAEGCRGHLGKQLINTFDLNKNRDPQHYAIGLKELWTIPKENHRAGLVMHGTGWPLTKRDGGGWFLYHLDNCQVAVGLIVDLNYRNPYLNPYEAFQRLKQHPELSRYLKGGTRVAHGARAIAKGGFNSLPKMNFPGGLLIGCDAGTLNPAKIKGCHTAMKSGLLAAESIFDALSKGDPSGQTIPHEARFKASWLYQELHQNRNFSSVLHKFGPWLGGAWIWLEQHLLKSRNPITLHDTKADHDCLLPASQCAPIHYPKADGIISFDKLSSVYLSNNQHQEDQPCHLKLADTERPIQHNLSLYDEPAQRYCPAGVYEIVENEPGEKVLRINAQNCIHCKTCDIKDPSQNITWTAPEGGSGPNYQSM